MPRVTGGSLEAHRREARARVFDAFSRLLYERGYDAITLADIAEAADMARTSMYNYCERLRDVCFSWSGGLVAHHYTRYLGDLSGGQVLGRIVQRVYELPDGKGASAYRFDAIDSPKRFKDDYRDERRRIADEANVAFECSRAVFDDLARTRV